MFSTTGIPQPIPPLASAVSALGNVYLSVNSSVVQVVTPTTYDQVVFMPDTGAYQTGGVKFIVTNAGLYPMQICNTAGVFQGWLASGVTASLVPVGNAGAWKLLTGDLTRDNGVHWFGSIGNPISPGTTYLISTSIANGSLGDCSLTSRYGICWYINSVSDLVLMGYDRQEFQTTFFSKQTVASMVTTFTSVDICPLSSTTALLVYATGATIIANVLTLNPGASTLSLGTQVTVVGSTGTGGVSCCALSSTAGLVTYNVGSSQFWCAQVGISGTVCSAGTPATVGGAGVNGGPITCKALSATLAYILLPAGSTSAINRVVISGTTVTPSANTVLTSKTLWAFSGTYTSGGTIDLIKYSSTQMFIVGLVDGGGNAYGTVFTDTGSSITVKHTLLALGGETSQSANLFAIPTHLYANDSNGTGLLVSSTINISSNAPNAFSLYRISCDGSSVFVSSTLQVPPNMANISPPSNAGATQLPTMVFPTRMRTYNGIGNMVFGKANASSTTAMCAFSQSVCFS